MQVAHAHGAHAAAAAASDPRRHAVPSEARFFDSAMTSGMAYMQIEAIAKLSLFGVGRAPMHAHAMLVRWRRRIGFRHVMLVRQPLAQAWRQTTRHLHVGHLGQQPATTSATTSADVSTPPAGAGAGAGAVAGEEEEGGGEDEGESFYLAVNGLPLFMRGANLIPLSVLHAAPRAMPPAYLGAAAAVAGEGFSDDDDDDYDDAVQEVVGAAVEANMNMLRVWYGACALPLPPSRSLSFPLAPSFPPSHSLSLPPSPSACTCTT